MLVKSFNSVILLSLLVTNKKVRVRAAAEPRTLNWTCDMIIVLTRSDLRWVRFPDLSVPIFRPFDGLKDQLYLHPKKQHPGIAATLRGQTKLERDSHP